MYNAGEVSQLDYSYSGKVLINQLNAFRLGKNDIKLCSIRT